MSVLFLQFCKCTCRVTIPLENGFPKCLKTSGLCTYLSTVLPEPGILCSKLFCAVKVLIYIFYYSKRKEFGFESFMFSLAGTSGGR